jgi:tryptophan synthase alpha chain
MSRIHLTFQNLMAQGQKAFVAYCMAGFPDRDKDLELARGLLAAGADMLEIGVPFSDPLADGPIIQRCGEEALLQGGGLPRALELARILRKETDKPLLLMSYVNPPFSMGLEAFMDAASEAGIDGLILPDLSPEEALHTVRVSRARGIDFIPLAAPTSTRARLKKVASVASGFIYFVSVAGVTGDNKGFDSQLSQAVEALRKESDLPIVIGFGVSSPEKAHAASELADGAVTASAVLKPLLDGRPMAEALDVAKAIADVLHRKG